MRIDQRGPRQNRSAAGITVDALAKLGATIFFLAWLVFRLEIKRLSFLRRYYDLSFAKRPAEELYVLAVDGDQVKNVVDDQRVVEIKEKLAARLTDYLKRTGDPRETDAEADFDEYPYIGGVPKWPGEDAIDQYER